MVSSDLSSRPVGLGRLQLERARWRTVTHEALNIWSQMRLVSLGS